MTLIRNEQHCTCGAWGVHLGILRNRCSRSVRVWGCFGGRSTQVFSPHQPSYTSGRTFCLDRAGYNDFVAASSKIVPTMNMPQQWNTYRMRMQTIFTAPFSGVGYFVVNSDDYVEMRMTQLGADGVQVSQNELILDAPYTRYLTSVSQMP